jgi:phenylpyruvate tautomerase PptA (4-oxalocrotonate tautomerase family)
VPVVEISMIKGRSPNAIAAISDAVHDALVECYEMPADDRFQIIRQCEPHELIFDRSFMGGPRSAGFVLIQITAGREREVPVKQALFRAIATGLQQGADVDPEEVFIMLANVATSDLWLAGGRPFSPPTVVPRAGRAAPADQSSSQL